MGVSVGGVSGDLVRYVHCRLCVCVCFFSSGLGNEWHPIIQ